MSRWTIGRRLAAGFAAVLMTAVALGAFAYARLGEVRDKERLITQGSLPGEFAIGQFQAYIEQNYVRTLMHLVSSEPAEKQRIEAEMAKADAMARSATSSFTWRSWAPPSVLCRHSV